MLKRFFLTALLAVGPASADEKILPEGSYHVLGRWCDEMLPNNPSYNSVIEIRLFHDGSVGERSEFGDGSSLDRRLTDAGKGLFKIVGSGSGDMHRIVPNNGELQLLDDDGYIRTAKRLENVPQPGDCLP